MCVPGTRNLSEEEMEPIVLVLLGTLGAGFFVESMVVLFAVLKLLLLAMKLIFFALKLVVVFSVLRLVLSDF